MADIGLQASQHPDRTEVAVIGALEGRAARAAHHQLRRIIDHTTPPRLMVDLRCCTGIDTHGILTLATAARVATARGGCLTLTAVPPLIRRRLVQDSHTRLLLQPNSSRPSDGGRPG